ncbi:glycine betaine/proline transport system ATP-binding protein [Pseudorhodobacter antarcticus]|jgi:glycine betaine/proline transport system ATP-binding protein|uniref:Quaternary amine transport ATP-binding protein n=1 Tax=Pseudorhodobacter antarcticus TaxID=1077947 RepID=A0A1H8NEE3_9RHOB|nr:betaine/proline/choline family ABC transporter ATP-binding protein [Pseudorhodobacter antarcticus]SEO27957.1 glycine betaine/proline transport system ATP-binding protein [Pseudorhodobacter antarcticus]
MTDTDIKISIRNLYKIFGDNPGPALEMIKDGMGKTELLEKHGHVLGLNDINVDVPAGKTTVIMGLSGSGKSTLIRHLNRLIEPTAGEVWVDGENIMEYNEKQLRHLRQHKMSMVFQKFALLPHRTVLQNAGLAPSIEGQNERKYAEEARRWLDRVGLQGQGEQYPHQLSGGMQQRVGIARALTSNSDIMLMDEAFSALDPLIRTDMQNLLNELQAELQKTIVFITHDLDEALKLADHLVILKDGFVVQQGEPQNILLNPADPYIEDFVSDINRARVLRVRSVMTRTPDASGERAGEIDHNDNLESVIALSEGDTSLSYRVMKDGKPVGVLDMRKLVRALVPSAQSDDPESARRSG